MDKRTSEDAKKRLARIAGQVNGVEKMVTDGRHCVDVLTQVAAIKAAVDQLGIIFLSTHLELCLNGRGDDWGGQPATQEQRLEEIRSSLEHFLGAAEEPVSS